MIRSWIRRVSAVVCLPLLGASVASSYFICRDLKQKLEALEVKWKLALLSNLLRDHMDSGDLKDKFLEQLNKRSNNLQSDAEKLESAEDHKFSWENYVRKVFGEK